MAQADAQFIKPETILKQIGLQGGMQVADLGCGAGYFALPAARLVGSRGKVYAVDVQKSALAQVRKEAQSQGMHILSYDKYSRGAKDWLCDFSQNQHAPFHRQQR